MINKWQTMNKVHILLIKENVHNTPNILEVIHTLANPHSKVSLLFKPIFLLVLEIIKKE